MMWSEIGHKHPGWDCYVFKKDLYKKFNLGDTIVGAVGDGEALRANMKFHSKKLYRARGCAFNFSYRHFSKKNKPVLKLIVG